MVSRNQLSQEPDSMPKPDPTALTTVQLEREIKHLRELMETRLDYITLRGSEVVEEQRLAITAAKNSSELALQAALATSDKAILELSINITKQLDSAREVTDNKFVTYKTLLDSESQKVALAHAASDKAISKAEVFNEKRFEILTAQMNELKEVQSKIAGKGVGIQASWTVAVSAITVVVIVVNVILFVISRGAT